MINRLLVWRPVSVVSLIARVCSSVGWDPDTGVFQQSQSWAFTFGWACHLTLLPHTVPSPTSPATLEKPVLSLHPPWTTIFKGERVTLRCDGYHPLLLELRPISTLWYLGHVLLPSHKKSIEVQAPGVYRCQTRGAPVSDPIHLSVSNGECWPCWQGRHQAIPKGQLKKKKKKATQYHLASLE